MEHPTFPVPDPLPQQVSRNHWLWPYIRRDLFWKKYSGFNIFRDQLPTKLLPRPGFGTAGRPYKISVNSYEVTSWPTDSVYQYDVSGNHRHTNSDLYSWFLDCHRIRQREARSPESHLGVEDSTRCYRPRIPLGWQQNRLVS